MRPIDVTRLRRVDVLAIPGGVAQGRGVSGLRGPAIVLLLSAMTLRVSFAT
jgi:hypothetical protein